MRYFNWPWARKESKKEIETKGLDDSKSLEQKRFRILVIGSRGVGAYNFSNDFDDYLKDKAHPIIKVETVGNVDMLELAFYGRDSLEEGRANPVLPLGVVLFPELRRYVDNGDYSMGHTIDTRKSGVSKYIKDLCKKYNVPVKEMYDLGVEDSNFEDEIKKIINQDTNK